MNQQKIKCNICDLEIIKELTKEIKGFTVCANCFIQMVLDKNKRLRYQVGGDF
jgi:hypothetical protein